MNSKNTKKEPILACDPNSDKWINISQLFELEAEYGNFQKLADGFEKDVIRFINECCVVDDETGRESQNMFHILYKVMDTFRAMQEVKC